MYDERNEQGRCPYCNKKLAKLSKDYAMKHISRCSRRLNPYQYSERSKGRPTKKEVEEAMKKREEVL